MTSQVQPQEPIPPKVDAWLGNRTVASAGTNHGAKSLPFQSWQRFKEAYTPEIVLRAVEESYLDVQTILDPFGGSGTTGLAAQFLGITPVLVEVNPYLADVIRAKLTAYDYISLSRAVDDFCRRLSSPPQATLERALPPTFLEGGGKTRWVFNEELGDYLLRVIELAGKYEADVSRFLKVSIGGGLVALSNVRVNGKGRRYRGGWQGREKTPEIAAGAIEARTRAGLADVAAFGDRPRTDFEVVLGDARRSIPKDRLFDLCVFSPPYPNSFDYTDVYNVELWMLGYLSEPSENRELRVSTLSSHVQILREFAPPPTGSTSLGSVMEQLDVARHSMWSRHLPNMVGGYFADMMTVMDQVIDSMNPGGAIWAVVGDSKYAGVEVPVAQILLELAQAKGLSATAEVLRSMRSSPQHGGLEELPESLLTFRGF